MTIAMHEVRLLDIRSIHEAPWNANKVSKATLDKIRRSLQQFGSVENLVVRPRWCCGTRNTDELDARRAEQAASLDEESFECLSGNHRLSLYRENRLTDVLAAVVELTDPRAKMLAQALNRLGGKDDPDKLKELLKDVMKDEAPADVASILPHSENDLLKLLNGTTDDETPTIPPGPAVSEVGVIYELGPHRVLCGSSCDPALVAELMAGATPPLMVTDPPYGVNLAQGWRDAALNNDYRTGTNGIASRLAPGRAQDDRIEGDDGFDWTAALGLVPAQVAYLWHAGAHAREAEDGLTEHNYDVRQQIIWKKKVIVMGRQLYHWQHEPCWMAVRKGSGAVPWYGGRNQSTVWDAPSPRQIMGRRGGAAEDAPEDHPTQKPVLIFERPIVNHLAVGEVVYDPFLGSGTCLIAAAKNDRVCFGADVNPRYVDLIRRRWTKWATENGRDPGSGALEPLAA